MSGDFDDAFEAIARAMIKAKKDGSVLAAELEAERSGLTKQASGPHLQKVVWETRSRSTCLRFQWRWYDQSQAFSIRPDMNILSLELREGERVVRSAEERFEDCGSITR